MTRDELIEIRDKLMEELVRRRKLGDYSADAAGIRFLCEVLYKMTDYLADRDRPRVKK